MTKKTYEQPIAGVVLCDADLKHFYLREISIYCEECDKGIIREIENDEEAYYQCSTCGSICESEPWEASWDD